MPLKGSVLRSIVGLLDAKVNSGGRACSYLIQQERASEEPMMRRSLECQASERW